MAAAQAQSQQRWSPCCSNQQSSLLQSPTCSIHKQMVMKQQAQQQIHRHLLRSSSRRLAVQLLQLQLILLNRASILVSTLSAAGSTGSTYLSYSWVVSYKGELDFVLAQQSDLIGYDDQLQVLYGPCFLGVHKETTCRQAAAGAHIQQR